MPLLYFMGVDYHGNSLAIGLCFMDREVQANYDQALTWLIDAVYTRDGVTSWSSTIVTGCQIALTNTIDQSFPPHQTKGILLRAFDEKRVIHVRTYINQLSAGYQAQVFHFPVLDPLSWSRGRIYLGYQRAQARGNAHLLVAATGRTLSQFG
ncbi:hypothetical protein K3495_g2477 [Podosphaera aphanis]|nr:hypothetical protein K3495_g2477 [Podosphaera aphanis]